MRILIDENVSAGIANALAERGHDVERVAELNRSADDDAVLELAISTDRILITFDSDFGRLIFAEHKASPRAVIYLRSPPPSPEETVNRIVRVLDADAPTIDGFFVSIDSNARFHPLPMGSKNA